MMRPKAIKAKVVAPPSAGVNDEEGCFLGIAAGRKWLVQDSDERDGRARGRH